MNKIDISEQIWDVISKKWNLRILKILDNKTVIRFNELKQSIPGLSANILSNRLDELEKFGLIKKISSNNNSLHMGYMLTERCNNLKKMLLELDDWVSSYQLDESKIITLTDSALSVKILDFLKKEISETEFNFIKDKLLFSFGNNSLDIVKNYDTLKNIIFELFGEETGNKIVEKLNKQMNSFKIDI